MNRLRIFVSSVQKEFAAERVALRDYLRGDALLRRYFDPFLFEDVPARDQRADDTYLAEVERCDLYVGLFGNQYGIEDAQGLSAVQREFDLATRLCKHRVIFVKGTDDAARHPKMQILVREASNQLIRKRFITTAELILALYASLIEVLTGRGWLRSTPFDAAACEGATLGDLDEDKVRWFLRTARAARGLPLAESATVEETLIHLNLLRNGFPTNAAVLLFGKAPQRFLLCSEVKCARFHGPEVAKPIPAQRECKGTAFDLVDQAADFILSKIDLAVGTRATSTQAPVAYEIPPEVVREGIVNAVAHRDYTSNGSVQVMLFSDRLEIWNPGALPPSLTPERLRQPHGSVPGNPLLAEPLYLAQYIERMGTGIPDMFTRCRAAGLPDPEIRMTDGFLLTIRRKAGQAFETVAGRKTKAPVEAPVKAPVEAPVTLHEADRSILLALESGEMGRSALLTALGLKQRSGNFKISVEKLLRAGYIEWTVPAKPSSRLQKYRMTEKGRRLLAVTQKQGKRE